MNLYILTQEENNDYDTYDSCIVCANTLEEAVLIRPSGKWGEETYSCGDVWATKPENVMAVLIGIADKRFITPEVILSSFNAG